MSLSINELKLLTMFTIGAGSFIVGLLPGCLVNRGKNVQKKLFLSGLLCFGGGVLLATSILHMLPETKEALPEYGELVFCCGFFLLYFTDEIAHYFMTKRQRPSNSQPSHNEYPGHSHVTPTRPPHPNGYDGFLARNSDVEPNVLSAHSNFFARKKSNHQYGALPTAPEPHLDEEESFLCHGPHTEPCAPSNTSHFGLALALILHATLEGMAIGLQKQVDEVWLLIAAVFSHKFVMAFCLGLELAEAHGSICRYISTMLLFSGGSSLGIGLGMLAFNIETETAKVLIPALQGLAGGTLLYVTVSEVLPRERARWHNTPTRVAGIVQFISVCCGFILIFFCNKYLEIEHHH